MFLYPFLGIRRGVSTTPIESYVSWTGISELQDRKLICLYELTDDDDFKLFEKTKLLSNPKFSSFYELPDNKGAYLFDFNNESELWDQFVKGNYTKFGDEKKKAILKFFEGNISNHNLITSYLYPDKYYETYASHLAVPIEVLKEVGQLCSPPNLDKENLTSDVKQIQFLDYI
jgi:hypothetical protein